MSITNKEEFIELLDSLSLDELEDIIKYIICKYGKNKHKRRLISFVRKRTMDIGRIQFLFDMLDIVDNLKENQSDDILDFLYKNYNNRNYI